MMTPFDKFLKQFKLRGLTGFGRYYGVYRGFCHDPADPDNLGRIRIRCPSVLGDDSPDIWVWPRGMPSGPGHGFYWVPVKDAPIYVTFEEGDSKYPLWEHGWYPKGKAPTGASPTTRILQSPTGLRLEMDDAAGTLTTTNQQGFRVVIGPEGIEISRGGRTVGQIDADTYTTIEKLTVGTPLGPSTVPLNVADFINLALEKSLILK